ncbi:trihelix transcription factor GTL1 isoform X2 [Raphanus sativus]|uniref:Trihelix transcription factor GTL1 isoform X2 n=1 Tax=Raphanus sativus TaxID=3726 RepID=A0A9W3BYX5_RAPSA|nr:trihelix transcription factor GTL1 isoform X2 [Raphanus sativus]
MVNIAIAMFVSLVSFFDMLEDKRHQPAVLQSLGCNIAQPDLAPPPQKLKPIRCLVKPSSEDPHPLDILAGSLDRLPEMGGFLEVGCFDAPLGSNIADVEESGQLTRGFGKGELEMVLQGRVSTHRASRDRVSLSSSADSDSDGESSQGVGKAVTGKRKRETREKLERFMEKLVGTMMKRQEKMDNQLINVMEKMERERVRSEEAWRQQEMERMKQNEEARKQEMSRSSSLISFIKSLLGEEIKIAQPLQTISNRREWDQTQGEVTLVFPSGRRWPQEEVQALIASRSEVEEKTGVVHKGAIWNEISARMKVKGYERSAKKCKEKWENMNKYYKRVMESSKKQPEHTKTCSYFEKLGNFYKTNSVTAEHSGEREQ